MEYDADSCTSSPLNMSPPESFEAPNVSCSEASLATSADDLFPGDEYEDMHEIPSKNVVGTQCIHIYVYALP